MTVNRVHPIDAPEEGVWTEVATADQLAAQRVPGEAAPFALAVKANIAVRGFVRSAGCPALVGAAEEVDAPVVAALRAGGAVVVGMTNLHELAFGITSDNRAFGPVRLPGHPDRSAGGSSGGSAVAVATGAARLALATDTGGSAQIPASHCGVVGFRPSVGRWPTAGIVGLSWTRDTPGVFARTVAEVLRADQLVAGRGPTASGAPDGRRRRLGIPAELVAALAPETESAFEAFRERVAGAVELVEVPAGDWLPLAQGAEMPVVLFESHRLLADVAAGALGLPPAAAFEALADQAASPDVRAILGMESATPVSGEAYDAAMRDVLEARARYESMLDEEQLDGLVFPTAPAPAPLLAESETVRHLGEDLPTFPLYTRNTGPGTMLGAPMIAVPLPVGAGALPVGATVQGRRFEDARLLEAAAIIERALAV